MLYIGSIYLFHIKYSIWNFPCLMTLQAQTCLICVLWVVSSSSSQTKSLFVQLFTEHWTREKRPRKRTSMIYICNRKVVLPGFIEVYNPRIQFKISLEVACSRMWTSWRELSNYGKKTWCIAWFTLIDTAMFSSVYF